MDVSRADVIVEIDAVVVEGVVVRDTDVLREALMRSLEQALEKSLDQRTSQSGDWTSRGDSVRAFVRADALPSAHGNNGAVGDAALGQQVGERVAAAVLS